MTQTERNTAELSERAEAARRAIDELCIERRFFAYQLAVPGAQLTSTPFFCVAVVPGSDGRRLTFYFCVDPELNIYRPDPMVVEIARGCVSHAIHAVQGLGILEHRIEYRHVGIPPVDPESLVRPPPTPALSHVLEVTPQQAAEIATAFFKDHIQKHGWFVDEIKAEVPWLESATPINVRHVLWVEKEANLVVYVRLDETDLDKWHPPKCIAGIFDAAIARLHRRHAETARFPIRLYFPR